MKKTLLSLFVFCLLVGSQARASHIAGGDLSYVCLGNNQYQINLNLFVDCLGFDPGNVQTVNFNSPCGATTISVNALNPGGTEISQLCPQQINNSTCSGGNLPGMWVFHYTGTVTLAPCSSWTMSWDVCCRNNAVLNLVTPFSFGSYIEATLNNITSACDNSPSFTAQPIPYVCQGQLVNYSYGVTETDGDSLYYSLINAMDAGGVSLAYSAGYSASSPIPGITLNPFTGMLTFTPATLGNFVVVVLVEEYDSNGNLIGTVMRDIQFIVQNCSNSVPDPASGPITSLTGTAAQTGPFSVELCEGASFTFNTTYSDPNPGDILTLISNLSTVLPGATITTSGTNPITATISWTAPAGTANTNTTFSVTVNDGSCPVPGQQTFVYDIQVNPRTLAGPDQIICGPQTATLDGTGGTIFNWVVLSGPPMVVGTNFSCNPCATPIASPASTTVYEVTSDFSGTCGNKDTVTITVVPDYTFNISQSTATLCMEQSVQFSSTENPAGAYTYLWGPSVNLDNTSIYNPTATLDSAGTFEFDLTITSPLGCVKHDTVSALVQPAIRTIATGDSTLCGNQSANLSASGGTTFTWAVISGPAMVVGTNFSCNPCANPVATPSATTTYYVTSDLTGTCVNTDTVTVTVVADFTHSTSQSDTTSCLGTTIQLNSLVNPAGSYSYTWSPSNYLNNTAISNPVATITTPGAYDYVVNIESSLGCFKLDTITLNIVGSYAPSPILSYTSSACLGDSIQLSATFGTAPPATCGTNPVPCNASLAATVGIQSGSNSSTTWPAIFGNWYTSEKHQMLFRASELIAAGITGGKIDQIDIPVSAINGITVYHQFTIKMGCTNLNALGTTWASGLYQVFGPATVNVAVGMNTCSFTNAFEWDGISNVIVEICSSEGPGPVSYSDYTNSSISPYSTTPFMSCLYSYTDQFDMCPDQSNFTNLTADRPVLKFHYCGTSPDTSNYSYAWSPNLYLADSTSQFTGAYIPGDTTFTLMVTDMLSGCADTASISVVALPPTTFNLTVGNDVTICPGTPTTLSASGATTYSWSPATGLSSTTAANPVASPTVTTTYTVIASTPCAPTIIDSVTVSAVNSVILNVSAGTDLSTCPGAPVTLNATGATTYTWTPATALSNANIANPVSTLPSVGTITYTVTGNAPCANPVSDVVTVTAVNSVILNVDAGDNTVVCPGVLTQLTATGATQYVWSPAATLSNANIDSPLANPSTTTTYTVIGTAYCADPVTDSVTVSTTAYSGPLTTEAGSPGSICVGEPFTLNGASTGGYGNNNYMWSVVQGEFNDSATSPTSLSTPIITAFPGMNVYELQVVDQCGYMSADTVIVDVLADCMVIIPNIFTPNGDGDNDEFIIADEHGGIKTFSMAIFNRWGKKVFETSDIRNGWNGDNSPDGTYFYIITAETSNGQPFNKQGYFQLLGK